MKHLKLITLLLFISLATTAQQQTYNVDFLNNGNTPWNWTTTDPIHNPDQIRPNNNSMLFDGARNTLGSPGNTPSNFIGASAPIGQSLCNTWVSDFTFTPTHFSSFKEPRAGGFIFSLAAGGGNPYRTFTTTNGIQNMNADMIALNLADLHPEADLHEDILLEYPNSYLFSRILLVPYSKNGDEAFSPEADKSYLEAGMFLDLGPEGTPSNPSPILNHEFDIKLERISETWCRLSAFDVTANEDKGSICFPIPEGITNLNHIHFTNHPGASTTRGLWGNVTDLTIQDCFTEVVCCTNQEIMGPDHICLPGNFPLIYSVESAGDATYEWVLPDGTDASDLNDPTLEIYNIPEWLHDEGGEFTVELRITCGCVVTVLTRTITVTPDVTPYANFTHSQHQLPNSSFPSNIEVTFEVTGLLSPPPFPTTSVWDLYATSNGTIVGSPLQSLNNTTLPFSSFSFAPVDGGTNNNYQIVHSISVSGSGCAPGISIHGGSSNRTAPPSGNGGPISQAINPTKKGAEVNFSNSVYPNPSKGMINVSYKGDDMTNARIILRDMLGRELSNQSIKDQLTTFELSISGIYTIEIWNGKQLESVEKVIIE